jgi:uncharacterized membrane protein
LKLRGIWTYLIAWISAAGAFAGLDAIWLISTNATLYRPVLAPILLNGVRPVPAVLFYLVYLTGTVIIAIRPALKSGRWITATGMGATFGFFAYATYDLTNQATLAVWATKITIIDLCWGTVLTATGATVGYLAGSRVRRA